MLKPTQHLSGLKNKIKTQEEENKPLARAKKAPTTNNCNIFEDFADFL
jgi:hypothetical protein